MTKETITTGTAPVEAGISGVGETENPISKDVTICAYDGYNRLTTVKTGGTTVQYTYNGDGLRTAKTINGTTTTHVWDGAEIVYETTGAAATKYIRGTNLIAKDDGTRRYYLFNGHGDVIQLTGTDGSVTKNYDYDAWGNEKNPDVADANPFRYCGEYFDKETGTIYLRARYYNPAIGRFTQEDSYWGSIDDPLSLNLYTYCSNNPIMYVDETGHAPSISIISDNFYGFSPDSTAENVIQSAFGFIPFVGDYFMKKLYNFTGYEVIDKDNLINSAKNKLSFTADLLSQAKRLGDISKLPENLKSIAGTVGEKASFVSTAITSIDIVKQLVYKNDCKMNNLVYELFREDLFSTSKEGVLAKYAYSLSKTKELIDNGKLTYSATFNGKIKDKTYNAEDIEAIRNELKVIDAALN